MLYATAGLTFPFWCCANYSRPLNYLIRVHFRFVRYVRFDFDCQVSMPSAKRSWWWKNTPIWMMRSEESVLQFAYHNCYYLAHFYLPFVVMWLLYPFERVLMMLATMMTYPLIAANKYKCKNVNYILRRLRRCRPHKNQWKNPFKSNTTICAWFSLTWPTNFVACFEIAFICCPELLGKILMICCWPGKFNKAYFECNRSCTSDEMC